MLYQTQIYEFLNILPFYRRKKIKNAMRGLLTQKRRILTEEQVAESSSAICERLEQLDAFKEAKTILLYYPIHGEVDLRPLLEKYKEEKNMLLPVAHRSSLELRRYIGRKNLKRGHFGIPEPQTPTFNGHVDLFIIPGVGFDRKHHRLGRGGGYYDRFLRRFRHTLSIGVAYDFQIVKEIPTNILDKRVHQIVTPTEVI